MNLLELLKSLETKGREQTFRYPYSEKVCPCCGNTLVKSDSDYSIDRSKHDHNCALAKAIDHLEKIYATDF